MKLKNISIQKNGFTLIETLISISILVLISVAVAFFQADVFSLNRIISVGLLNQGEVRAVVRPFAGEVRGAVPSNTGSYPIEMASSTEFIFYSNIDDDILIERVRYFLEVSNGQNRGDFKKGVTKPEGSPLSYNLETEKITEVIHDVSSAPIFYYFDSSYDGTASSSPLIEPVVVSHVRLVKIILQVDSDPENPPLPIEIQTQASIRNLKDNL